MFHNRTWTIAEFAYRTQRYRGYPLNGSTAPPEPAGSFIYNGGTSSSSSYAQILDGKSASFTSWQNTIQPPDANGNYPVAEA